MLGRIEAILPGEVSPLAGVDDGTLLQHEDAPSGEGGGVIRPMEAPQPRTNGPRGAQGGAPGATTSTP